MALLDPFVLRLTRRTRLPSWQEPIDAYRAGVLVAAQRRHTRSAFLAFAMATPLLSVAEAAAALAASLKSLQQTRRGAVRDRNADIGVNAGTHGAFSAFAKGAPIRVRRVYMRAHSPVKSVVDVKGCRMAPSVIDTGERPGLHRGFEYIAARPVVTAEHRPRSPRYCQHKLTPVGRRRFRHRSVKQRRNPIDCAFE
jgi:hypothetical protein